METLLAKRIWRSKKKKGNAFGDPTKKGNAFGETPAMLSSALPN
jgi:hypothetical protein